MKTDQLRGQSAVVKLSGRFWTRVHRRLDDGPALIINIMVSDEDAPMEIWHENIDSWNNEKQLLFWHLQRGYRCQSNWRTKTIKMNESHWEGTEVLTMENVNLRSIVITYERKQRGLCSLVSSTIPIINQPIDSPSAHVNLRRAVNHGDENT